MLGLRKTLTVLLVHTALCSNCFADSASTETASLPFPPSLETRIEVADAVRATLWASSDPRAEFLRPYFPSREQIVSERYDSKVGLYVGEWRLDESGHELWAGRILSESARLHFRIPFVKRDGKWHAVELIVVRAWSARKN